jgi:hypothetical protein
MKNWLKNLQCTWSGKKKKILAGVVLGIIALGLVQLFQISPVGEESLNSTYDRYVTGSLSTRIYWFDRGGPGKGFFLEQHADAPL